MEQEYHDVDLGIKCVVCDKPILLTCPIEETKEELEQVALYLDIYSLLGQRASNFTIFEDSGNYGSTLLDCEEKWGIVFHDWCLKGKYHYKVD